MTQIGEVVEFWRFGDLTFWRFGVLAFWRFYDLTIWRLDDLDVWNKGIDFVEEVSGFTQIAQMTQI